MRLGGIHIEGACIGSRGTNIRLPGIRTMFDIGVCPPEAVQNDCLLITHGHPDHAAGIINYLFQRKIQNLEPPHVFGPPGLLPVLEQACSLFSGIHYSHYPAVYHPLPPGQAVRLPCGWEVIAWPASHSIETYAYTLYRIPGDTRPEISYSGDTLPDILDAHPQLYESRVLLMECTYLGDDASRQLARDHYHTHLEDVVERWRRFNNQWLVLVHRAPRYRARAFLETLRKDTPESFHRKVRVFS